MENQERKIPDDAEKPDLPYLSLEEIQRMTPEEQLRYDKEQRRSMYEAFKDLLVPEEVKSRGEEALRVYNEELVEGTITVNHARLMFTGKEGVGKTCLVNSLLGKPFNENEQSTNGIVVWTTAFFCSEWKEETNDVEDWKRTKQMLESTVEGKVAEKLKQTKSQTEAFEQATSSTSAEHDAVSNPAGTELKRGEERKKDVSNRSRRLPVRTLKRIGDIMVGKTSRVIGIDDITFMWDFAGQQLYYITHRIFLTSEAVYLILFNLMEGMHKKGKCRFSKMANYVMTYDMTNIQIIKYWMRLIYTYAIPVKAQQQLQAKKPQIVVVGTHSDCLEGTEEDTKKQIEEQYGIIFQEIRGTPYESHVVRKMYPISNKCASECEMLKTLKQDVGEFLKEMPKTIPLKWLKFQQILQENGRTAVRMTYVEVCKVATACGIFVENIIHALNYLHDLGVILYFENNKLLKHTVITNPRKLIDILKKIITEVDPDDDDKWPLMIELWNKLDDEGILEEELARHLWRDEISRDETCFEVFLELMKQFGLLCERIMNQESNQRSFFVPCRLKRSTDSMATEPDMNQMVSIYMASEDFIPDSIFHPLVVSLIGMIQDMGYTVTPKLFSNYASIVLGRDHILSLGPVVIDNKPSLKLKILRMPIAHEDGTSTPRGEPSPRVCMQVLEFLKQEMKVLTTGMKHTGYTFRVLCWMGSQEIHFHDLEQCLENNSIVCGEKLIPTDKLQRMFKNKKPVTGNPSLPGPSVEISNTATKQPDGNLGYVDDMHLSLIAKDMGLEWKQLGLKLGLKWNKIQQIWSDNKRLFDCVMEMLIDWRKQQNYEKNQVEILCRALQDQGLTELANNVFGSQTSEDQSLHQTKQDHDGTSTKDMAIGELNHYVAYPLNDRALDGPVHRGNPVVFSKDVLGSLKCTNFVHMIPLIRNSYLTDMDLQFIAKRLDNDWKYFGVYLSMKRSEINQIAADFSPPMVDACIEMLVKWRSRQEPKVNHLAKIIDALTNLEREDIIEELKPYYQEKDN